MRGGLIGNLILVIITVGLLAVIFGLFFGVNLLDIGLTWITLGMAAVIDFFAEIINTFI